MANTKPTAQTGAMTLVFLVKQYKNQMIALLVKNGVVVNNNSSDQQIAMLMANLLKVSKSYFNDLNNFIMNPTVAQVIANKIGQTAQYLRMSGHGYMNADSSTDSSTDSNTSNLDAMANELDALSNTSTTSYPNYTLPDPNASVTTTASMDVPVDPVLPSATIQSTSTTPSTSTSGGSWWTGIKSNLGNYLSQGLGLVGTLSTNQANTAIAQAHSTAVVAQSNSTTGSTSGGALKKTTSTTSTTTIIVFSVIGVAVAGFAIYYFSKMKKE